MENRTAKEIVDEALAVHKALGPGLLESVYEKTALFHELVKRGLKVERQVPVTFVYDGHRESGCGRGWQTGLLSSRRIHDEWNGCADAILFLFGQGRRGFDSTSDRCGSLRIGSCRS